MADDPAFRAKWKKKTEERAAEQKAAKAPTKDPTGGGMSPAFAAKYQEAQKQLKAGEIPSEAEVEERARGATITTPSGEVSTASIAQPTISASDMSWWEKTKEAWRTGMNIAPATPAEINQPWETAGARLAESLGRLPENIKQAGTAAVYGTGIGTAIGTLLGLTGIGAGPVVAANVKTVAGSTGILTAMGVSLATAGMAVSLLGTYPFAGFIDEEATQTLNFAFKAARDAGDVNMMTKALDAKAELLGVLDNAEEFIPDSKKPSDMSQSEWEKLPIANVMASLKRFVAAEKITLEAQRLLVTNIIAGTDKYTLEQKQREESQIKIAEMIDKLAKERIQLQAELSKEEFDRWAAGQIDLLKLKEEMQERNQKFWLEYLKEKQKYMEERGRSQLGFGLLG